jgi:hypothetical protein
MATYTNSSPYYTTDKSNGYLDVIAFRNIPAETDDILFEVTSTYTNRPDLLANDLYGDSRLWWVFSVRNASKIKDPVYDLVAGVKIYLPKLTTIKRALGV